MSVRCGGTNKTISRIRFGGLQNPFLTHFLSQLYLSNSALSGPADAYLRDAESRIFMCRILVVYNFVRVGPDSTFFEGSVLGFDRMNTNGVFSLPNQIIEMVYCAFYAPLACSQFVLCPCAVFVVFCVTCFTSCSGPRGRRPPAPCKPVRTAHHVNWPLTNVLPKVVTV